MANNPGNAAAGAGGPGNAVARLAAPDDTSIFMFFGHSSVDCTREVVSRQKIVTIHEEVLPPNMLTVSFGTIGELNSFTVQKSLIELSRGENKSWLYDPITHYNDIEGYVNEKLANDDKISKDAAEQTTIVLSMGKMVKFNGMPLAYVPDEIADEDMLGIRRVRPHIRVYKSGLCSLAKVATAHSEEYVRIEDFGGEYDEHPVDEIKSLFSDAVLPSDADLDKLSEDDKTLPEWNKEFEEKINISTTDLKSLALQNPGKFHIFYLGACRGQNYSRNLPGMAKATRDASLAEAVATVFVARPSENERTEQLRKNNPLLHTVKKGGSRKKRPKSRQRKYTRRTRRG